jgi:hypothetical protein
LHNLGWRLLFASFAPCFALRSICCNGRRLYNCPQLGTTICDLQELKALENHQFPG